MPNRLIIRCTASDSTDVEWLFWPENDTPHTSQKTPITAIPRPTEKYQTIVLVPSEWVNLQRIQLPTMTTAKMLKAVPYALEEQVIEDISTLHFALGPIEKNKSTPVATVKKAYMERWIKLFFDAHIEITYLIPEIFALPCQPDHWSIFLEHNIAYVRTGLYDGYAADVSTLPTLLSISYEEAHEHRPEGLDIYGHIDTNTVNELTKITSLPIKEHDVSESALVFLANSLQTNSLAFNLLQGDYRVNGEMTQIKKLWSIVGILAIAWFLSALGFTIAEHYSWNKHYTSLQQKINAIYFNNYPQATSVEDPQGRMQRDINNLQNNIAGGGFLSLMGKTGSVLHQYSTQEIQLQAISFNNDALTIAVQAKSFNSLQNLSQAFKAAQLDVKEDGATSKGQGVQARFTIKRGNS